jgi:hypothetical protein
MVPCPNPSPVSASGRSTLSPTGRGKGVTTDAAEFFSPSGRRWRVAPDEGWATVLLLFTT